MSNRLLTSLAVILGVLLLLVGFIYATHTANAVPAYFPGHADGSSTVHTKHAIASVLLGIACFVFAWFKSAPKKSSAPEEVKR